MKKWSVSIVEKGFHFRENQSYLSKKLHNLFKMGIFCLLYTILLLREANDFHIKYRLC